MLSRARLTADAANRAIRTVIQAVLVEVGYLVIPEINRMLQDEATIWDWNAVQSLIRVAAFGALSYIMRRYLDPSPIPTPLPPSDPGVPAEAP